MQVFKNNVTVFINQTASSSTTSIVLDDASDLPVLGGADWFTLTFYISVDGVESNWEIVKVTNVSGNTITCVRGFEGTTQREWPAGAVGQIRNTANTLLNLVLDTNSAVATANNSLGIANSKASSLDLISNSGSSLIGHIASGTGAAARTVQSKLREFVSVKDFGAVGDGVADDTLEIQAAIDYADSIGAAVYAPAGSYLVSSLTIPEKMRFYGDGMGITKFIQTGSAISAFIIQGAIGTSKLLTADAAEGTKTLLFDTTGLAADDWILLVDTFSYNTLDANYKSGQLVQILSVDSAAQVTLYQALSGSMFTGGSYTTANGSNIRKMTFAKNITLENFSFEGDIASTTYFCIVTYAQNLIVNKVGFKNLGNSGLYIRTSQGVSVADCVGTDILDDQTNGHSGYGVALGYACSDVIVTDNIIERCRHGFTTLGGKEGFAHNVLVANNVFTNTSLSAIDTHACGADIVINGNSVHYSGNTGISIRSKKTVISNNYIVYPASHGISCGEESLSNIRVINNTITSAGGTGILVANRCNNLHILNNNVFDSGVDGIALFASSTAASTNTVVAGNVVQEFSRSSAGRVGIFTTGSFVSTGGLIKDNFISCNGGTPSRAIRTLNLTDSVVSGNIAKGTYSSTVFDIGANFNIDNNLLGTGNYIANNTSATGATPALFAAGYDTNIDIAITPKGTGNVRFGTLTANADAPVTGYITIKDAGGTARKLAVIT